LVQNGAKKNVSAPRRVVGVEADNHHVPVRILE
jgi:hypothetical protein